MEINETTNSLTLYNKSSEDLTIIVEYIHYVETLSAGQEFKIIVKASLEMNLLSFFNIEYTPNTIIVLLNNKIEDYSKYSISFYVDGGCVYEQMM